MNVLLLGRTGLLGTEIYKFLSAQDEITFKAPTHHELDVLDFKALDQLLAHEYFDKIILCVAQTDVERAETEQGACELMNVKVVEQILAHRRPIIHFSTDYVFNAPSGLAIPENYSREPLNWYGETKAQAEVMLETSGVPYWNIRTSWLFGPARDTHFVAKILKFAQERDTLDVVDDQIGRPTYAPDLAEVVFQNFIQHTPESGHYHLQNTGSAVSWAGFAEYFLNLKNWDGQVKKVTSQEFVRKAVRPTNSVLANTKLNTQLRSWQEAVTEFIDK